MTRKLPKIDTLEAVVPASDVWLVKPIAVLLLPTSIAPRVAIDIRLITRFPSIASVNAECVLSMKARKTLQLVGLTLSSSKVLTMPTTELAAKPQTANVRPRKMASLVTTTVS